MVNKSTVNKVTVNKEVVNKVVSNKEKTRKPISDSEASNRVTKKPSDLDNIRVVLVRTFHSGNIGSAARAMKTMGLTNLILVSPNDFQLDQALQMAMSADDVVTSAQHVESLYEAVSDCSVVIGSTARSRDYDLPMLNPENAAANLLQNAKKQQVALVFGPERMGLSNEDLVYCTHRATIPTNPDYSSLNLAAAVQTLSYEVFKQYVDSVESNLCSSPKDLVDTASTKLNDNVVSDSNVNDEIVRDKLGRELPTIVSTEKFYVHLEETLTDIDFIFKKHPGKIMKKLRRLFDRAQMDNEEMGIMRGILASMQKGKK